MTAHIYLGRHRVEDVYAIHTNVDKVPRIGEVVGIHVEGKYVYARVHDVEWKLDDNEVNIFLD